VVRVLIPQAVSGPICISLEQGGEKMHIQKKVGIIKFLKEIPKAQLTIRGCIREIESSQ
jgi:hypothetical protein